MQCQVCESRQGIVHQVRERMYGTGEQFAYFECAHCKCLQLMDVPENMSAYYPADKYYSYHSVLPQPKQRPPFRQAIANLRNTSLLFDKPGPIGWLAKQRPGHEVAQVNCLLPCLGDFPHLRNRGFEASVLDIGCGTGLVLHLLAGAGFRHLEGIDPYVQPVSYPEYGISIRALSIEAFIEEKSEEQSPGKYDLIVLYHSLEHMTDTGSVLAGIRRLLAPGGICIVAIPITGGTVWERYGVHWIELDAPRHLILHSVQSMKIIAKKAGMPVQKIIHKEDPFGFWGSEMYRRDIPYYDESTGGMRAPESIFTGEEMAMFAHLALEANARERGGRALFYLQSSQF